jgi:hypothetical protein
MNVRGIRTGAVGLGMALIVSQGLRAGDVAKPLPLTEVLIADRQKDLGPGQMFGDTAGQLWRTTDSRLLRWDGKARTWEQMLVLGAPRPHWDARPTPPWHGWAFPPRIISGENGSLLAVVVRDVYQEIDREKLEDKMPSWREVVAQGQELAKKRGREYWLEARLYRDGKWSEASALDDLLGAERRLLLESFPGQAPEFSFFDMQASGTDLWWSDGTAVHVLDGQGKRASWACPKDPKVQQGRREDLHRTNLVRLSDGTIWFADGLDVYSLRLTKGMIEAALLPEAKLPGYATSLHRQMHVARDGSLLLYRADGFGGESWVLREGKWVRPDGVGLFVLEDPGGALWFLPGGGEGYNSWKGYNILRGEKRLRLAMPGDFPKGHVATVDKGTLLAAGGDRVFLLVRTSEEPGWSVKDVVGLQGTYENGPVWLDGKGNIVGRSGWSAKLPEAKLKDWARAVAEK